MRAKCERNMKYCSVCLEKYLHSPKEDKMELTSLRMIVADRFTGFDSTVDVRSSCCSESTNTLLGEAGDTTSVS